MISTLIYVKISSYFYRSGLKMIGMVGTLTDRLGGKVQLVAMIYLLLIQNV